MNGFILENIKHLYGGYRPPYGRAFVQVLNNGYGCNAFHEYIHRSTIETQDEHMHTINITINALKTSQVIIFSIVIIGTANLKKKNAVK